MLICGSHNQTTMMHQISKHLTDYDCYFTPFYSHGFLKILAEYGFLDFTVMGNKIKNQTIQYLAENKLRIDLEGMKYDFDLVVTCSDLVIPKNIRGSKIILVQEGMTDPENLLFTLVKKLNLPRYLASTSATGLSDVYDYFCVASGGYKNLFISKGVDPDKIIVTGIPNFDNVAKYMDNDFPYTGYVLAATSDARETFKLENRKKFIYKILDIAGGRDVIFKLHPNEKFSRAIKEIKKYAPGSRVFTEGNVHHMVANSSALVTKYSTVVYTAIIMGKEVYSDFDIDILKNLSPIQNGGSSALNIAFICALVMNEEKIRTDVERNIFAERYFTFNEQTGYSFY